MLGDTPDVEAGVLLHQSGVLGGQDLAGVGGHGDAQPRHAGHECHEPHHRPDHLVTKLSHVTRDVLSLIAESVSLVFKILIPHQAADAVMSNLDGKLLALSKYTFVMKITFKMLTAGKQQHLLGQLSSYLPTCYQAIKLFSNLLLLSVATPQSAC